MPKTFRQALRETRERLGVSRGHLALSGLVSESHLRNVENGYRQATLEFVEAVDQALGVDGLLTDLYVAEREGDDMRRRLLLGALSTLAGLGGISETRLVAEALRASLVSAIGGEDWQEIAEEHGRRFVTDAPPLFQAALTGDLLVLRQAIRDDEDARTLQLAAPRLMTLAGMALANTGDVHDAARWYRSARLAADHAGDPALIEWVRGRQAFRRGYEGANPAAVLAAADDVDGVEAQLAAAQAYARLGEKSKAAAARDRARRAHERCDQADDTIYGMPPWRLSLSIGYEYALEGDVGRCEGELERGAPPPAAVRWEGQRAMTRAVAYARAGDTATGAQMAEAAMSELPDEHRVVSVLEMYREARCDAPRS